MISFFCSICMSDKYMHPTYLDQNAAKVNCDVCGSELQTSYCPPEGGDVGMLTLERYNEIHGLDNQ